MLHGSSAWASVSSDKMPFWRQSSRIVCPLANASLASLAALLVTDQRVQARTHRQTLLNRRFARFWIRFQSVETEIDKRLDSFAQQVNRFERGMSHHRHHDIQLKVAAGGSANGHAGVVAHHAGGQLHHRFAHHRIDLAGHD